MCKHCNAEEGHRHHKGCPDELIWVGGFKTKRELEEFLEKKTVLVRGGGNVWYEPGEYYLDNGEYERPDYIPTRYKDGWGLKVIYYYYSGTLHAPKDGRVEWVKSIVSE